MPKKIKFESFKYRFLMAAQDRNRPFEGADKPSWEDFINALDFSYNKGTVDIGWKLPTPGSLTVPLEIPEFYVRGDNDRYISYQKESGFMQSEDPIKLKNDMYFQKIISQVAGSAGFSSSSTSEEDKRLMKEREFHDSWASSEGIEDIDVLASNEACTAPEMRYITQRLGKLQGKRLLDVGCGLGEASVYFALRGAEVTSSDLSQGMLDATCRLARLHDTKVTPHVSAAEDLQLSQDSKFDIIYTGNLLHHVDIEKTLIRLKRHLAEGGILVTWDPLAYNPAINVYRSMATDVRTPDEHPLKWTDIKSFHKYFNRVETRYFWLTTLVIFVFMAVVQRRNPNRERFWKVVVQEGEKWRWLYSPLEKLDRLLLQIFPPMRLLCWNVVVVSSDPK